MKKAGAAVLLILGGSLVSSPVLAEDAAKAEKPFVYTNADLPPPIPTSGTEPPAAPAQAAEAPPEIPLPEAILSYDSHKDRDGHGEGWWRNRAAELDLRILGAMYEAQKAHVAYARGKQLTDRTVVPRSREATKLLLDLQEQREGLVEQLRQSGGFSGWLPREMNELPTSAPLPAPVPDETLVADGLTLSWKPVQDARFYLLEVQCLDCCGPIEPCEARTLDVTEPRVRVPFEAGRSGRWRARALDARGFGGEWSGWFDFSTGGE